MDLKPSYERTSLLALAKSVGVGPEIVDLIPDPEELVPHLLRDIPGDAGSKLRAEWYRPFFGELGRDIRIGLGATFLGAGNMKIGDGCFFDDGVFLDSRRGNGIELGAGVRVCNGAYIIPHEKEGYIKIGHHSYIGARSKIFGHAGVELGHNVLFSPGVTIVPYQHEFSDPNELIINQGGQTGIGNHRRRRLSGTGRDSAALHANRQRLDRRRGVGGQSSGRRVFRGRRRSGAPSAKAIRKKEIEGLKQGRLPALPGSRGRIAQSL